jgi:hypothetical protein
VHCYQCLKEFSHLWKIVIGRLFLRSCFLSKPQYQKYILVAKNFKFWCIISKNTVSLSHICVVSMPSILLFGITMAALCFPFPAVKMLYFFRFPLVCFCIRRVLEWKLNLDPLFQSSLSNCRLLISSAECLFGGIWFDFELSIVFMCMCVCMYVCAVCNCYFYLPPMFCMYLLLLFTANVLYVPVTSVYHESAVCTRYLCLPLMCCMYLLFLFITNVLYVLVTSVYHQCAVCTCYLCLPPMCCMYLLPLFTTNVLYAPVNYVYH